MFAPCVANLTASARPMPRAAPVITTVLFFICMNSDRCEAVSYGQVFFGGSESSDGGEAGFVGEKADMTEACIFAHCSML